MPNVLEVPRPGEELAVLVERAGHHPVGRVEGLLDAVAVVDVDVDVQDAGVVPQQLEDAEDDVCNGAKGVSGGEGAEVGVAGGWC